MVVVLPRRGVESPGGPPNSLSQLFGGEPSGFASRQIYQSRFGLSFDARLSLALRSARREI